MKKPYSVVSLYRDISITIPELSPDAARQAVAARIAAGEEMDPSWMVTQQPPRIGGVVTEWLFPNEVGEPS